MVVFSPPHKTCPHHRLGLIRGNLLQWREKKFKKIKKAGRDGRLKGDQAARRSCHLAHAAQSVHVPHLLHRYDREYPVRTGLVSLLRSGEVSLSDRASLKD